MVVDGPDSWAKDMVEEGIAEKFIAVDMRDADSVFDRTLAAIKARPGRHMRACSCCAPPACCGRACDPAPTRLCAPR